MGTRSTTRIYEITAGASIASLKKLKPLLTIYRQMDGYPSGMGKDLADFLKPMTIVNGFNGDHSMGTHANGVGCLAAQLVKYLKDGLGGIYIVPEDNGDEEYNYHIYVQSEDRYNKPSKTSNILIRVTTDKQVFSGTVDKFADWCNLKNN